MQQNRISLSYVLAVLYVGIAFIQASPQGSQFTYSMALLPHMVKNGEIWRLATYVFLHEGGMINLFFKALIAVFICSPLEMLWGRRFLLIVFWGSTLLGGVTATLCGIPLSSGAFVSLTFFLIHGFTYPQSQIYVFFILPVKIKYLAIFSTVVYLLHFASMGIVVGMGAFIGMLSGVILWRIGLARRWDRPGARIMPRVPTRETKQVKSQRALIAKCDEIVVKTKEHGALDDEDAVWIGRLDTDVVFDEPLCAPFSFDPAGMRCHDCGGFRLCLKRDTLSKVDAIIHPPAE